METTENVNGFKEVHYSSGIFGRNGFQEIPFFSSTQPNGISFDTFKDVPHPEFGTISQTMGFHLDQHDAAAFRNAAQKGFEGEGPFCGKGEFQNAYKALADRITANNDWLRVLGVKAPELQVGQHVSLTTPLRPPDHEQEESREVRQTEMGRDFTSAEGDIMAERMQARQAELTAAANPAPAMSSDSPGMTR
jgi:hypothetical protein